jgi:phenylacetate-CoA ligase
MPADTSIYWPDYINGTLSLPILVNGLNESQNWPNERIISGQHHQLAVISQWAAEYSPWYSKQKSLAQELLACKQKPDQFLARWHEWPILQKTDIRVSASEINATAYPSGHGAIEVLHTSGSTGIPVEIRNTGLNRLILDALSVREHQWQQRDAGKRLGVIRHLPKNRRIATGTEQSGWGPPVEQVYKTGTASGIHIGYPVNDIAKWFLNFDPHYLLTYPSVAEALLDNLNRNNKQPSSLLEVRHFSEPLDKSLEERLQSNWGVRSTDMYSANECGHIAFRCKEENNLHVQQETIYVEVINHEGQACQPGEEGRIIITPLHNFAMPLIRYELGDVVEVGKPCTCGKNSPVLASVKGRVRNLVKTPDGREYWPTGLAKLRAVAAVRQAQFVQTRIDCIQLRLVIDGQLTDKDYQLLKERAQAALRYPFNIDISLVDSIACSTTGKFEEFLSLLNE